MHRRPAALHRSEHIIFGQLGHIHCRAAALRNHAVADHPARQVQQHPRPLHRRLPTSVSLLWRTQDGRYRWRIRGQRSYPRGEVGSTALGNCRSPRMQCTDRLGDGDAIRISLAHRPSTTACCSPGYGTILGSIRHDVRLHGWCEGGNDLHAYAHDGIWANAGSLTVYDPDVVTVRTGEVPSGAGMATPLLVH